MRTRSWDSQCTRVSHFAIQIILKKTLNGITILRALTSENLNLPEESQHDCGRRKAMFYRSTKGGRDPNPNILLLDKQVFIAVVLPAHTHTSSPDGLLMPAV